MSDVINVEQFVKFLESFKENFKELVSEGEASWWAEIKFDDALEMTLEEYGQQQSYKENSG